MPKSLRCPSCGTPAIDKGEPLDANSWYEPFCPSCQRVLTREGLLIENEARGLGNVVREIGKGGQVLWEYSQEPGVRNQPTPEDARRLLVEILELEERSRPTGKAVDIKVGYENGWNRKAAARRFRRWFEHENAKQPFEIGDRRLRELAGRILRSDENRELDYDQIYKDMIEEGKYLDEIYGYEERKFLEPPLVFAGLPPITRAILEEAQEAHRWGLSRSVFAVCRSLLEDAIRRVLTHRLVDTAIPIERESLELLISCLPDHLLNPQDRRLAHRIRKAGNDALHSPGNTLKEEPIEILSMTAKLVKLLIEANATSQ